MTPNTNNICKAPNTIHCATFVGAPTTCNATIATPNNHTNVVAKVTCKRCLAKLGKIVAVEPIEFVPELEHNTPDVDETPELTPTPVTGGPNPTEGKGNTKATPSKKSTKVPNVHLFHDRPIDDVQKNGKPRPNTLCSISGGAVNDPTLVTCKVCLSVMAKNEPKIKGGSK